ncbi:MAG: SGNH/GDSL hydrolase family protein [Chloroflexi bacterium]|nr:MAG: SGNH/GDSL hydrolase family protein [Chloroflexota bacterium]
MTYLIWILLVVLAVGQPAAKGPAMAPSEVLGVHANADHAALQGKVYVALGDSISAGRYATASDDTFPAVVAEKLGMSLDLVARSGAKAGWGITQMSAVQAAQPGLVTIELGTRGLPRGGRIGSWLPSTTIDAIIADTCERHGGTFVSLSGFYQVNQFHAQDGGSSYLGRSDWFHPGDQGHAAIAAAVLSVLGAGPAPVVGPLPSPSRFPDVIRTHPK